MRPDRQESASTSRPLLPTVVDGLAVGVAAVDVDGRQSYVNDSFARLVGWPRDELVGAHAPFVYWPPDEIPRIQHAFDLTLRGLAPADGFTLRFRRRDGTRFDALVHLGPIAAGGVLSAGWVAAVIDISAQTAMRRAMEDAARRLEALQRATSELTATLTREQVADVVMRAMIPAVGGTRGSVALVSERGDELEVIAMAGYPEPVRAQFRRLAMDAAFPITDAVRERRPLLFGSMAARVARYPHLAAVLAEHGTGAMASIPLLAGQRVLGAIGISWSQDHEFNDEEAAFLQALAHQCSLALERARLYEEERQARQAAEEANRAKGDFLAAMSHELRTPLNGIAGYVDLLLLGVRGPLSPEQQTDLERIRFNQQHLASLIEDVLSFARIEAGKLEVEQVSVRVDEVLRSIPMLVEPVMRAAGVRFEYLGCEPSLAVLGDRERIVQICVNLLANAARATARGGLVRLGCEPSGEHVLVFVSDTGCGIPSHRREDIFSPFTQLGRSFNAPRTGTGLGLSISRGLAEAMGGTLTVESEVGAGSTFTLALARR